MQFYREVGRRPEHEIGDWSHRPNEAAQGPVEPWARTCAACRRTRSTRSRRSHGRLDTRRNADGRALPASGGTMATGPRRVGRDQSGGSGLPEQPWVLTRGAVRARRSVLGVSAHDHPDPAVGIDHPVAGGRAAESSPMPKGAVPTDPDGRREAVNVPVAAMGAPDGDLHRAGMVPVREAVEHHRGVGGSSRHRDRLSGSRDARSGAPRRQVAPRTSARSRTPPPPGVPPSALPVARNGTIPTSRTGNVAGSP